MKLSQEEWRRLIALGSLAGRRLRSQKNFFTKAWGVKIYMGSDLEIVKILPGHNGEIIATREVDLRNTVTLQQKELSNFELLPD